MSKRNNAVFSIMAVSLLITAMAPLDAAAEPVQRFVLRDEIGQDWQRDLVFFELEPALAEADADALRLLDAGDREHPVQFVGAGEERRIAFLADLPALGQSEYRLVRGEPRAWPAPFEITRDAGVLRIANGITGVEVPTEDGRFADGPIRRIRLRSGAWIGDSRLVGVPEIEHYETRIVSEGPVFVDIVSRYRFAGGNAWELHLRLIAGEPVVLIRESFEIAPGARWEFAVHEHFSPTHVVMRPGESMQDVAVPIDYADGAIPAVLAPWVQWWDARQAKVFTLLRAEPGDVFTRDPATGNLRREGAADRSPADWDDDVLIAAAGDVAAWARSGPEVWDHAPQRFVPVHATPEGELIFRLPLIGPGRYWMLAAGTVGEALGYAAAVEEAPAELALEGAAPAAAKTDSAAIVPESRRLMNRYCETPLDDLKQMTLHWERSAEYPRLVLTREEVAPFTASPGFAALAGGGFKRDMLSAIAGRPLEWTPQRIAAEKQGLLDKLDHMVAYFRYDNNRRAAAMFGTFIPRLDIGYVLPPMELALGAGLFTSAEEERILARLAFVADKIARPDYVSPGRSLAGNPNMVTAWAASLVLMACMLPDHPNAMAWYREGMGRLDHMLENWRGPKGGWLEAPHYQIVAMDTLFLAKIAAANSGFLGEPYDERLLRTILFLAKTLTPPDPRFDHRRHFPAIGHTYLMETSVIPAAMARQIRDRDPVTADALQWAWRQQGSPSHIGLGGAFALDFYRDMLPDHSWTPDAPDWGSELFPGFGAVLRSGFPGDRETYMVYHQGDVATAHYDDDQGSFEMWGKGQPLCLDWGYRGYMPAWMHNRMNIGNAGKIHAFASLPAADYLLGRQNGGWDRQVLLVKDDNPLGPNYFVIRETTGEADGTADWWLWVNTRKDQPLPEIPPSGIFHRDIARDALPSAVRMAGAAVHIAGEQDVDLDVWLAPDGPDKVAALGFRQAAVSTVIGNLGHGWSMGRTDQVGMHLPVPRGEPLLSVLYPRLQSEDKPAFTELAGGRGVRIDHPWGTDFVFLAREVFEFADGTVRFHGAAGVIQRRDRRVTLTLCAPGRVAYGEIELESDEPRTHAAELGEDHPD